MKTKSIKDARTAANTWLAYIYSLKDPPQSLREINRAAHIASYDRRQKTYVSFVDSLPISANGKNKRISGVWKLFTYSIKIFDLGIENPINLDVDLFSEPPRRAKTPRTPLSREMLVYIQEFNRRDGAGFRDVYERLPPEVREDFGYAAHFNSGRYAFSRSLRQHHFDYRDSLTGELRKTWWPGVAVLLETLLEVPVRGFQARFLDSGELDELAIDLVEKTMVPNHSPKARASRQKGVFYIAEDLQRQPIVGLFINTNKTGISKDGGYHIPWCPAPLLESIPWLMQWNRDHGNIGECRLAERLGLDLIQNPVVKGQIGTSALIFRDPITNDGWPCTPKRLSSYWTYVLGAVERELKAMGFKYDLTRTIEKDDGSTEVEALFDIHTLRVSGITAMIEAGLPAEFVQEVVGHASVVMTLYYTRIRAGVLNERLSRFREGISDAIDPADIPELQFEDVSELLRNLVNRRDPDAAVGASMLRANPSGLGNGSFNVFADGICPGGECSSGGEAVVKGFAPVPRHRACSLCRYRLTGPMFLAGLVYNANRLMFELRKLALQIRDLVQTAKDLEEQGRSARIVRNQIDGLYRQTEDVSIEWSAEVQYVHAALALLQEASDSEETGSGARALTLLSSETVDEIVVRLESKPDFVLLQRLADGADLLPGFRPNFAALSDHREFLNHVLDQNGIEQFLLRLDGPMRDRAARLLGHAIVSLVPEDRLDELEKGSAKLTDFNIIVSQLAEEMAAQVARSKRVEFAALRGLRDLRKLIGAESELEDAQLERKS